MRRSVSSSLIGFRNLQIIERTRLAYLPPPAAHGDGMGRKMTEKMASQRPRRSQPDHRQELITRSGLAGLRPRFIYLAFCLRMIFRENRKAAFRNDAWRSRLLAD
jgi:hypothetical protein